MRKVSGVVAVIVGLLLVTAAPVVHWVVAPRVTVLPSDTHAVRVFAGTAEVVANPTATGVMFGPGIMRDVPITILLEAKVLDTAEGSALVRENRHLAIPSYTVADLTYAYSVDRKSIEPTDTFPQATQQRGLTFNWPIGTEQRDYLAWVPDTQTAVTARFVGVEQHGGMQTYAFRIHAPESTITDPQMLDLLPSSMTKEDLLRTTPSLQMTKRQLLRMAGIVDRLPDPVPLTYSYRLDATYWIAPDSGVVVDASRHEVRTMSFVDGHRTIPVTPVLDMSYRATPATVAAAVADARDAAGRIKLVERTVPLVALAVGAGLLVSGGALLAGRRREPADQPPVVAEAELYDLIKV